MDQIIEQLTDNAISEPSQDPESIYKFADLYKSVNRKNQEDRRRILLNEQKKRRGTTFDNHRFDSDISNDEKMQWNNSSTKKKRPFYNRNYQNQLMFSEWLIDIPINFEEEWLFLLCPNGHRTLLVTSQGTTFSYNKNGVLRNKFTSLLPGGSNQTINFGDTVLDCIWSSDCKQFFVLDLIRWGGRDFSDCSTEFRFFWLKSKFEENSKLLTTSKLNKFILQPLNSYEFKKDTFENVMSAPYEFVTSQISSTKPTVDGILFYHKESSYEPGFTPLVGWLKTYMIPEILSIPVLSDYMKEKPETYTNLESHINESKQEKHNWWTIRKNQTKVKDEMET